MRLRWFNIGATLGVFFTCGVAVVVLWRCRELGNAPPLLFAWVFGPPLAMTALGLFQCYFFIRALIRQQWLAAFLTFLHVALLFSVACAALFVLMAVSGILGVSTNPPY